MNRIDANRPRPLFGAKTPAPASVGSAQPYDPAAADPGLAPVVPAEDASPSGEDRP